MTVPFFDRESLGAAVHALLSRAAAAGSLGLPPLRAVGHEELTSFATAMAGEAGYICEEIELFDPDIDRLLAHDCPCIVIPLPGESRAYALMSNRHGQVEVLGPEGEVVTVEAGALAAAIREPSRAVAESLAARITEAADGVAATRLVDVLHAELYRATRLGWVFVFRPNVVDSVSRLLRSLHLPKQLGQLIGLAALQGALVTVDWGIIGSLALSGHADRGSLLGAGLLWMTAILFQIASTRLAGKLIIRATTRLRQRLLEGSLSLDPDDLSAFGLGSFTVVASQADASMGLIVAVLLGALGVLSNVVAAIAVLAAAPLPWLTVSVFGAAMALVVGLLPRLGGLHAWQQRERMRLSTDLVERMSGHATRLVQQTAATWHDGEDELVAGYAEGSRKLDRLTLFLRNVPRGYYTFSLVAVFFVLATQPTASALALSIGGLTLGMATLAALAELTTSTAAIYGLWISIRPILGDPRLRGGLRSKTSLTRDEGGLDRPIVELRKVRFAYEDRPKPILEEVDLKIGPRERLLVEGPAGGGKSTLAAILSGLRHPRSGLILVRGLDHHVLGENDLRRTIAAAPQFYRNHIFTGPLAFNLLLGRHWPPSDKDVDDADRLCRELGLGPLLDRMPAGIFQEVGDTGWQLSHGERSRVFLARTLLQSADVVVLDETLGALDPETVRECAEVVLAQDKAIVVVTHR